MEECSRIILIKTTRSMMIITVIKSMRMVTMMMIKTKTSIMIGEGTLEEVIKRGSIINLLLFQIFDLVTGNVGMKPVEKSILQGEKNVESARKVDTFKN